MVEEIKQSISVLQTGGLLILPTDLGWMLSCDVCNEQSISKMIALAESESTADVIVFFDSPAQIDRYLNDVPEIAFELMEVSDKPMIIELDDAKNIASILLQDKKRIKTLVPHNQFCVELIRRFKRPIATAYIGKGKNRQIGSFSQINTNVLETVDYSVKINQNDKIKIVIPEQIRLGKGGEISVITN